MLRTLILSFWLAAHPVHVTLLSVEYSADSGAFNVFLKVYYDDFLLDYKLLTGTAPGFDIPGNKDAAMALIDDYIKAKVQIFTGKTKLEGIVEDISLTGNELRLNLLYNYKNKSKTFTVKNSILTDIYKDQSNLLIFRYGDFEEGIKLTSDKLEQTFNVK